MTRNSQLGSRLRQRNAELPHVPAPTAWGAFARHYVEMVISMVVGMMALHPLWEVGLGAVGLADALNRAIVMALVMATDMSVGMAAWMRYRGHLWRPVLEMSATMFLPFAVLLPAVWAGAMSGSAMIAGGHLLMLPAMLALMLWRRDEYGHGGHTSS
ncbi:hypothetical protein GCM10027446_01320 [Angustibacter peucedani]